MLLALRSLFEPTVTPPVVVPPGFGGGGQTYPFRPVVPPRPPRREAVEVELNGIEARAGIGKLTAIGSSTVTLPGSGGTFTLGAPIIQAGATVIPKGIAVGIENSHRVEAASVILGQIDLDRSDDDEASMLLFLGSQ